MNINSITLPSTWGRDVKHRHISNGSSSLVVCFPGLSYSCDLPVLYYAAKSAMESNHDALLLEYGYQSARVSFNQDQLGQVIQECKEAILQTASSYEQLIFVSKSLGTLVAGEVAAAIDHVPVSHLFLTPINASVPYIQNNRGAVIYGTKDDSFSEDSIRTIKGLQDIEVFPIREASHALEVDTVSHSLLVMREIVLIYNDFFQRLR
ncbi:alpha/beta hydrolase [Paenibacillus marinisediminis]